MPNFHTILFKFCAYVNYMLIYKMHRERKFPMTIKNLAALFPELFEPPLYLRYFSNYGQVKFHAQLR